jgi:hypothetical protein
MSGNTISTPSIESIDRVISRNAYVNEVTWGVAILDQNGDLAYEREADVPFPAASFNKLSTVLAWRRNGGENDDTVRIEESDIRTGNGILEFALGQELAAGEVARLALSVSDNTALRTLVRISGGPLQVNDILRSENPDDGLWLKNTVFDIVDRHDTSPEAPFLHGVTSPFESALIFRHLITTDELAKEALSRSNYDGGLRGTISDPDSYRDQNEHYEELRKIGDFKRLQEFRFLESPFPGKEGTILDDEEHLRHHLVDINGLVVSAMTTISPRERIWCKRGERHHIRKAQARIGNILMQANP